MTQFGNIERALDHVNNPQDAAFLGGHELNESWKLPAANPSGRNASYMHPLGTKNKKRENAPTKSIAVAPAKTGKNKIAAVSATKMPTGSGGIIS